MKTIDLISAELDTPRRVVLTFRTAAAAESYVRDIQSSNAPAPLECLEKMVTWEPKSLTGPDAIARLEHINSFLYALLNPHPSNASQPVAQPVEQTRALTDRLIAAIEGECDGLMIGQEQASSILAYLQYGVEMYDTQFLRRDAERYRKLRDADINAIHKGGVFAGLTPDNVVINGEDLDIAVDLLIDDAARPASGETE